MQDDPDFEASLGGLLRRRCGQASYKQWQQNHAHDSKLSGASHRDSGSSDAVTRDERFTTAYSENNHQDHRVTRKHQQRQDFLGREDAEKKSSQRSHEETQKEQDILEDSLNGTSSLTITSDIKCIICCSEITEQYWNVRSFGSGGIEDNYLCHIDEKQQQQQQPRLTHHMIYFDHMSATVQGLGNSLEHGDLTPLKKGGPGYPAFQSTSVAVSLEFYIQNSFKAAD
ncbi:hypothetical protein STEG23_026131 [Scotinomys teguina]